jgi:hypothetical protein
MPNYSEAAKKGWVTRRNREFVESFDRAYDRILREERAAEEVTSVFSPRRSRRTMEGDLRRQRRVERVRRLMFPRG